MASTRYVIAASALAFALTGCSSSLTAAQPAAPNTTPGPTVPGVETTTPQPVTTVEVNRPGVSGDSVTWKGWGHVRDYVEEVPGRAA